LLALISHDRVGVGVGVGVDVAVAAVGKNWNPMKKEIEILILQPKGYIAFIN